MNNQFAILKKLWIVIVTLTLFTSIAAMSHAQCFKSGYGGVTEWNYDRPGSDFRNYSMPNPCAGVSGICLDLRQGNCQASCSNDARCLAWTYVKPSTSGGAGHCWLKDNVPNRTANNTTVSGVLYEYNIDRPGNDYAVMTTNSAGVCEDTCYFDDDCWAWTWVKSDHNCWLKSSIPGSVANSNTISGYYQETCIY